MVTVESESGKALYKGKEATYTDLGSGRYSVDYFENGRKKNVIVNRSDIQIVSKNPSRTFQQFVSKSVSPSVPRDATQEEIQKSNEIANIKYNASAGSGIRQQFAKEYAEAQPKKQDQKPEPIWTRQPTEPIPYRPSPLAPPKKQDQKPEPIWTRQPTEPIPYRPSPLAPSSQNVKSLESSAIDIEDNPQFDYLIEQQGDQTRMDFPGKTKTQLAGLEPRDSPSIFGLPEQFRNKEGQMELRLGDTIIPAERIGNTQLTRDQFGYIEGLNFIDNAVPIAKETAFNLGTGVFAGIAGLGHIGERATKGDLSVFPEMIAAPLFLPEIVAKNVQERGIVGGIGFSVGESAPFLAIGSLAGKSPVQPTRSNFKTSEGDLSVFTGLKFEYGQRALPIIGISKGRPVAGRFPKIDEKISLIEQPTDVFGTKIIEKNPESFIFTESEMLIEGKKVSPETQQKFFKESIELERLIGDESSVFKSELVLKEGTERLSPEAVKVTLDFAKEEKGTPFGSFATRPQLDPLLRRQVGDIDIMFEGKSPTQLNVLALDLAGQLTAKGQRVRVNPESPYQIESFIDGTPVKAIELKAKGVDDGSPVAPDKVFGFNLDIMNERTKIGGYRIASITGESKRKLAASNIFGGKGSIGVGHVGRFKDVPDFLRITKSQLASAKQRGRSNPLKIARAEQIIEGLTGDLGIDLTGDLGVSLPIVAGRSGISSFYPNNLIAPKNFLGFQPSRSPNNPKGTSRYSIIGSIKSPSPKYNFVGSVSPSSRSSRSPRSPRYNFISPYPSPRSKSPSPSPKGSPYSLIGSPSIIISPYSSPKSKSPSTSPSYSIIGSPSPSPYLYRFNITYPTPYVKLPQQRKVRYVKTMRKVKPTNRKFTYTPTLTGRFIGLRRGNLGLKTGGEIRGILAPSKRIRRRRT